MIVVFADQSKEQSDLKPFIKIASRSLEACRAASKTVGQATKLASLLQSNFD